MDYLFEIALSFATENQKLVEKVYHYLKSEGIKVFFAPSEEGQKILSGKNQREIFYDIFGLKSKYVALFVSKEYISKDVPMEEASIAFAKHKDNGSIIPIYIDGTALPIDMLNPNETNYYLSDNPALIANHIASKIKLEKNKLKGTSEDTKYTMNNTGNSARNQYFIQIGGNE